MKKSIIITIVLCIICSAIASGITFIVLNKDIKSNKTEDDKKVTTAAKEKYSLFNNKTTLENICSNYEEGCNKDLGKLDLGNTIYDVKFNLEYDSDIDGMIEDKESYIMFDNKKITLNDKGCYLRYIQKINDNLLGIVTESAGSEWYNLYIYDNNINEVKRINDAGGDFKSITNNEIVYTRHTFATAEDCKEEDMDETGMPKYEEIVTIKINGTTFTEEVKREPRN